jgi:hypothetical protein
VQRAGASSFLELQGAALLASFIGASWYPSPQQVGPSVDDLPGNFRHLKLNSTSPINGEQNLSL